MGVFPRLFSSDSSTYIRPPRNTTPNPNPYHFEIRKIQKVGNSMSVLWVHYPHCTTFDGNKVMILNMPHHEVKNLVKLDPHFDEKGVLVARFRPTEGGWQAAIHTAEALMKLEKI